MCVCVGVGVGVCDVYMGEHGCEMQLYVCVWLYVCVCVWARGVIKCNLTCKLL